MMLSFWAGWLILSIAGAVLITKGLIRAIEWLEERGW